jgi:hypothetical protein
MAAYGDSRQQQTPCYQRSLALFSILGHSCAAQCLVMAAPWQFMPAVTRRRLHTWHMQQLLLKCRVPGSDFRHACTTVVLPSSALAGTPRLAEQLPLCTSSAMQGTHAYWESSSDSIIESRLAPCHRICQQLLASSQLGKIMLCSHLLYSSCAESAKETIQGCCNCSKQ